MDIDSGQVIPWVAIAILLLLSALVSGSEVAFFSLSPSDLKDLDEHKQAQPKSAAARVLDLLKVPDAERAPRHLLATILVLNNLINIIIILISTVAMEAAFPSAGLPVWLQWTLHVALVTFLIVLFGEVIPKVYATSNSVEFAQLMARPLGNAQRLLRPVWSPLVAVGGWLDKRVETPVSALSVEDLEQALELTADDERSEEEQRILEGIVSFGSKDAKQVMTARTDMEALALDTAWAGVRAHVLASGYSRIPVSNGGPDDIAGILHVKDLLPHLEAEEFDWAALLRPPFYVPENKKIDDLLRDFQTRKTHIAIVVDEYGGTSGLITLEDIIEEIVGEISDEFDAEEIQYSRLDDRNCIIEAKTALIDVYRILELEEEVWEAAKGEADTLGGFVTEQAGRLLRVGESVHFEGIQLKIDAATPRKLIRIKVTLPDMSDGRVGGANANGDAG